MLLSCWTMLLLVVITVFIVWIVSLFYIWVTNIFLLKTEQSLIFPCNRSCFHFWLISPGTSTNGNNHQMIHNGIKYHFTFLKCYKVLISLDPLYPPGVCLQIKPNVSSQTCPIYSAHKTSHFRPPNIFSYLNHNNQNQSNIHILPPTPLLSPLTQPNKPISLPFPLTLPFPPIHPSLSFSHFRPFSRKTSHNHYPLPWFTPCSTTYPF